MKGKSSYETEEGGLGMGGVCVWGTAIVAPAPLVCSLPPGKLSLIFVQFEVNFVIINTFCVLMRVCATILNCTMETH